MKGGKEEGEKRERRERGVKEEGSNSMSLASQGRTVLNLLPVLVPIILQRWLVTRVSPEMAKRVSRPL